MCSIAVATVRELGMIVLPIAGDIVTSVFFQIPFHLQPLGSVLHSVVVREVVRDSVVHRSKSVGV